MEQPMKLFINLLAVASILALTGCLARSGSESSGHSSSEAIWSDSAAIAARAASDPAIDKAARQLVGDYLESQKRGDDPAKFGSGATPFYNLAEYNLQGFGRNMIGQTCFLARVKAGNKGGGTPTWDTAWVYLR